MPRLVLNDKQQRKPLDGGHHFVEEGVGRIDGETFAEVVQKLGDYRVANGLSRGNPERDVVRYYSEHYPFMVRLADGEEEEEDALGVRATRVVSWMEKLSSIKAGVLIGADAEAKERLEGCAKCPHFRAAYKLPDTEYGETLKMKGYLIGKGRVKLGEGGYCKRYGWDCGLAAQINSPGQTVVVGEREPGCWVG